MLATSSKSNPNNWERYMRPVSFACNSSVHSLTGYTPHYLMVGHEARLPVDLQFGTVIVFNQAMAKCGFSLSEVSDKLPLTGLLQIASPDLNGDIQVERNGKTFH